MNKENYVGNTLKKLLSAAGNALTDLLFPLRCPVCDKPVRFPGKDICPECESKLRLIREPVCRKCGKQLAYMESEYCHDCRVRKHIYDRGIALYTYESCRETLYRLKYSGRREYTGFLAHMMAKTLGSQIYAWRPDALIPVPLHPERLKKRGYNQAELLAEKLAELLNIPILSECVIRTRNTRPQKEVEGGLRQNNLKNSFKIVQNDVKLNTIVIIDDIYTTGSTIDALAEEFRRAGVKNIYFVTLAIGSTGAD